MFAVDFVNCMRGNPEETLKASPPTPLVSVIIPTWNGRHLLAQCLKSLASQTFDDFEVVVVDNGSQDDTAEWLRSSYPTVRLVRLPTNRGFAAATNCGIRATRSPLIVTLNNDTVAPPDFLAHLVHASTRFPEVGMFAATLLLPTSPSRVDAAGLEIDRLGVAWNAGRGLPPHELSTRHGPIFGPCAGAALYRRSLFEDVGLFEEAFFAYLEDAELAWRARWAGWRCLWVPQAQVIHEHSATGRRNAARKFWLLGRNRIWALRRHYPRPHLWPYLPLIVLHEFVTGFLASLVIRHPAPLLGRLMALRHPPPPVPCPRRLTANEMFAQLTPLHNPRIIVQRYRASWVSSERR